MEQFSVHARRGADNLFEYFIERTLGLVAYLTHDFGDLCVALPQQLTRLVHAPPR